MWRIQKSNKNETNKASIFVPIDDAFDEARTNSLDLGFLHG
jgi:hypothetical protein